MSTPQTSFPPKPGLGAVRPWIVVLAPLLLQAAWLYVVFHDGLLSGFVPWDDCLFVLRGIYNLDVLSHAASPVGLIGALPDIYVHSPVADFQALVGLLLTGGQIWGAYVLGAVWLMIVLQAVLRVCGSSRALAAALLIFVLIQPMAMSSLYLKADWKGGMMIAAAIYVLNAAGARDDGRLKMYGSVLLSLALLTKLSAFYLPAVAVVVIVLFDVLYVVVARPAGAGAGATLRYARDAYRADNGRLRLLGRQLAISILPFVLIYWLTNLTGEGILAYIHNALSGTWSDHRSLLQRAVFYAPFSVDGRFAWGSIPAMFALGLIACTVMGVVKGVWTPFLSLCVSLAVAAMVLAPLILAKTSNTTFAATLIGVVMGGALIGVTSFAGALPRRGGVIVLAASLALAATVPLTPMNLYYGADHTVPSTWELRAIRASYEPLIRYMALRPGKAAPRALFFFEYLWAPFPNVAIESFRLTGRLMPVSRVNSIAYPGLPGVMADTDFALTFLPAPGVGLADTGLERLDPASSNPVQADAYVAALPHFELVMTTPVRGGEVRLYANRALVKPDPGARLPAGASPALSRPVSPG